MGKIIKRIRHKNGFTFLLIIALLVQLFIPMSGSIISAEETLSTETSTLSTVSGSAVTVSGSAITASYINKIEIKDESGNDFAGEVEADAKILLKYSFEIPDDVIVDTTTVYTYTIPSEINIIENKTIEVKDGSRLVAMVNIKTDNTLTFQYMDEINNEDYLFDRSGFFWVYTEFDEIAIDNSGPKDIVFDLGGGSTTIIHVNFEQLPETADVR
ncbi:MAG: hypothetical protein K0R92_1799, partial [Lachnospiraceae bacterium]|nr:hypothetical protein [Lachnospiraceae bacterium]